MALMIKGEVQWWDRGRSSINIKSRFQLETTIINNSLYFFGDVFKVYLSNIDSETAIKKVRLWILGVGAALYYDLKYSR